MKNYDYEFDFCDGLAIVQLHGKFGYIDKKRSEVIPLIYDNAYNFNEGIAIVKLNNKYGVIDKEGKIIIPYKYDELHDFNEGLAIIKLNDKYGFIDKKGNEVISCKYDHAFSFHEGRAMVELNGKFGIIDKEGKEIVSCKYDRIIERKNGYAKAILNDKYYLIHLSNIINEMPLTNHISNILDILWDLSNIIINNDILLVDKYGDINSNFLTGKDEALLINDNEYKNIVIIEENYISLYHFSDEDKNALMEKLDPYKNEYQLQSYVNKFTDK